MTHTANNTISDTQAHTKIDTTTNTIKDDSTITLDKAHEAYETNKQKLKKVIEEVQSYLDQASDWSSGVLDSIKSTFESTRYGGVSTYHNLVSDAYSKTDAENKEIKELEHTLKWIVAKAKQVWINIWMEIKEKLNLH